MARYEHLPIYKQAMDVAVQFKKVVAGFSRYHEINCDADGESSLLSGSSGSLSASPAPAQAVA